MNDEERKSMVLGRSQNAVGWHRGRRGCDDRVSILHTRSTSGRARGEGTKQLRKEREGYKRTEVKHD